MRKMNQQFDLHYMNTGYPYASTETFMNLFDGLTYTEEEFSFPRMIPDEENAYWPMPIGFNKFGVSGPGSTSYNVYNHVHEMHTHASSPDEGRTTFENHSVMTQEGPETLVMHGGGSFSTNAPESPEECIRGHTAISSQVIWQDDIDPDNMTYEELLDLGEAVGTHSRGLSPELISSLPISKYKCGSFFSRKKSHRERCVICQMEYKRRDRQIALPCKHVYHASCGTRWLSINKACPVCYTEVFGEDSRQ